MNAFHAVVKNGRLTLDAPSSLPDGQVVMLLPLDELMGMVDEADEDGEVELSFQPTYEMPMRDFKRPKMATAKSLIEELKKL